MTATRPFLHLCANFTRSNMYEFSWWQGFCLRRALSAFVGRTKGLGGLTLWGVTANIWPENLNIFEIIVPPDPEGAETLHKHAKFLIEHELTLKPLSLRDPVYTYSAFTPMAGSVLPAFLKAKQIAHLALSGLWTPADLASTYARAEKMGLTCTALDGLTLFLPPRKKDHRPIKTETAARAAVPFSPWAAYKPQ